MEKNRKRALRRHHNNRMFQRAFRQLKEWQFENDDWVVWSAKRRRDNMKNCSCMMCANPRRVPWSKKLDRLTLPEIKFEHSYHDQLEEYMTLDSKIGGE